MTTLYQLAGVLAVAGLAGCASSSLPMASQADRTASDEQNRAAREALRKGDYKQARQHLESAKNLVTDHGKLANGQGFHYRYEARYEALIGYMDFYQGDVQAAGEKWRSALLIRYEGAQNAQKKAEEAGQTNQTTTMVAFGLFGLWAGNEAARNAPSPEMAMANMQRMHVITQDAMDKVRKMDFVGAPRDPKVRSQGAPSPHVIRVPVVPEATPFLWSGRVRNGNGYCTGTVLSARLVLTNAHCVSNADGTPSPHSIKFVHEGMLEDKEWHALTYYTHRGERQGWDTSRREHDWAIIVLSTPWTTLQTFPRLVAETPPSVADGSQKLMMAGYSGDLDQGHFMTLHHGCEAGPGSAGPLVFTNCDSFKGSSGAAVYTSTSPIRLVALNAAMYTDNRPYPRIALNTRHFYQTVEELKTKYPDPEPKKP